MSGRIGLAGGLMLLSTAAAVVAGGPDRTGFASAADIKAQVQAMRREMKPGQGFLWRPLVQSGASTAAIEIWKKPGKPAVHPTEAEYVLVVEGAGTMISGGTMVDAKETRPGLLEGSRIDGGETRRLTPGDVFLVPAGAPHWFGVTGDRLVLLGTKIPSTGTQ